MSNNLEILNGPDTIAHATEATLRFVEFHGWTREQLEAELARLTNRGVHGMAMIDTMAGARQRVKAIRELLTQLDALDIASWPPEKSESTYERLNREALEREDAATFDAETREPATDIATALAQREKALAAIDKAVDHIARAVATIRDADRVILEARPSKDARMMIHMGHVAERLQRRLGDAGVAPDLREDRGKLSPRLVELASIHSFISENLKGVNDDRGK